VSPTDRGFSSSEAPETSEVSQKSQLLLEKREKPCTNRARVTRKLLDDFTQLLVSSGAVDALASLFALCDRPKEQSVEPVPPAILAGLRLLESLIESGGSFPEGGVSEGQGSLIVALRATALAGLPSLLTSVLLQTENETRAPVLADPILAASRLPANFVPVATVTMRLLNNIHAVFGPREVQSVLSSSDLRVETHHLLSVCLAICCGEWDRAPKESEERRDGKDDGVHDGVVFLRRRGKDIVFFVSVDPRTNRVPSGRDVTVHRRVRVAVPREPGHAPLGPFPDVSAEVA
jgi:hypothetical protein